MLLSSYQRDRLCKTKTKTNGVKMDELSQKHHPGYYRDPVVKQTQAARKSSSSNTGIKKMAINKVSNFSDLIQRVTASCFLHPLAADRHNSSQISPSDSSDDSDDFTHHNPRISEYLAQQDEDIENENNIVRSQRGVSDFGDAEVLIAEVFEAFSALKKAYVSLQEAHCPWDPDRMRVCDAAVVAELRRIGVLRERFRRKSGGGERGRGRRLVGASLREVVAPYEAAVEELKREVKVKQVEVDNLKDKLKNAVVVSGGKKAGRTHHQSKRRVGCSTQTPVSLSPAPEIFEATMSMVREASKSFTALLLSLMKSAHWDIAAAVRSIEAAAGATTNATMDSIVGPNHAKYAMESYVNRKFFQGFDHETFYMDGSLSSLLHPDQFRRDCFTQYRDMKAMDPIELLGILPTCDFGKFCCKKYLSIIHPKMEESLFGDLEQRCQVLAGNHPRSRFYGDFLGLAKAIWLLHLLAFSLEPPPSYFEGSKGADFHSQYMESVVRFPGGRVVGGQIVGFPVSPGFKLASGSVIKARVYLVPKNGF
ncbi:protein GRAVITROPIC IN THE LIGHT 1 isoform X2 [Apium graveolens]|uniref:protein GRAVITROPIC IN THE LIGHT 1 isoform X2 n=1 Tax=Apium graveolens TaxID=4045 RepID=UPI003D79F84A